MTLFFVFNLWRWFITRRIQMHKSSLILIFFVLLLIFSVFTQGGNGSASDDIAEDKEVIEKDSTFPNLNQQEKEYLAQKNNQILY